MHIFTRFLTDSSSKGSLFRYIPKSWRHELMWVFCGDSYHRHFISIQQLRFHVASTTNAADNRTKKKLPRSKGSEDSAESSDTGNRCSVENVQARVKVKDSRNKSVESYDIEKGCSVEEIQARIRAIRSKYTYVFKETVAEKIAETILKHRRNPYAPVLDVVAGPGFVCREFLRRGVSKVVALETLKECSHLLKAVQQEFGSDRFCFFNWHMVDLYLKLYSLPNCERSKRFLKFESQVAELLQQTSSSYIDVPYSVVCLGERDNNEHFVFYVLRNLPTEDSILSHGHVEFFFLAHPKWKHKIDYIASIQKTSSGISSVITDRLKSTHFGYVHAMIHLFYDIEVLEQFHSGDFYPPFSSIKGIQDKHVDASKRLLIKMQLKKNVNEILPLQHHIHFINFIYQVYKKKSVRTIPALEMLIPGCGLRMLAHGFTMTDIISMSNPHEFVKLYKVMWHWPEFVSSPLHNHMMMKMSGSVAEEKLSDDSDSVHQGDDFG